MATAASRTVSMAIRRVSECATGRWNTIDNLADYYLGKLMPFEETKCDVTTSIKKRHIVSDLCGV